MALKKIGYYISKGKCVKVYSTKKKNRSGRLVMKKVNYRGKVIRKGTKIYKTKKLCLKALSKKMKRKTVTKKTKRRSPVRRTRRSPARKTRRSPVRRTKFGQSCNYTAPYFGVNVPRVAQTWSGTKNSGYSGSSWKWSTPPGAMVYDKQQGSWKTY